MTWELAAFPIGSKAMKTPATAWGLAFSELHACLCRFGSNLGNLGSPDTALEAVGPVLETLLSSLTQVALQDRSF